MHKVAILTFTFIGILGIVALILMAIPKQHPRGASLPTAQVHIGGAVVAAEVATTSAEAQAGLSGRSGLLPGHGMLFVFDPPQTPGFWMKDMQFSIDIIFINPQSEVSAIYADVSPDTYPQVFGPSVASAYVLEVPAGFAHEHSIARGAKVVVE